MAPALARVAGPAAAGTWLGSSLLPATLAYATVKVIIIIIMIIIIIIIIIKVFGAGRCRCPPRSFTPLSRRDDS